MKRILFATFVLGVFAMTVSAQPPAVDHIAAAKAAWQKRQDFLKSVRFEVDDTNTNHPSYYKTYADQIERFSKQAKEAKKVILPKGDFTSKYTCKLAYEGQRFYLHLTSEQWSLASGTTESVEEIAVTTDEHGTFYHKYPNKHGQVSRDQDKKTTYESLGSIGPITWWARGATKRIIGQELDAYECEGRIVAIDGRPCIEFTRGTRADGRKEVLYLDAERAYVLRRRDNYTNGILTGRLTVDYKRDSIAEWVPTNWTDNILNSAGNRYRSSSVVVSNYEINPSIGDDLFQPVFPPGTLIITVPGGGSDKETQEVVREDGSPGVKVPGKSNPSYQTLLDANAQSAIQVKSQTHYIAIGVAVAVVLAIAGVVASLIRRRKSNPPLQGDVP